MKAKRFFIMSDESAKSRMNKVVNEFEACLQKVDKLHVFISPGNTKTGAIPSVSLIPVYDCANCRVCSKTCYDFKTDMIYQTVRTTRCENSAIYKADPTRYFEEIRCFLNLNHPRAFRWHIGGDIKNIDYLRNMCEIAQEFPEIKFLAFTKMFTVCNKYLSGGEKIPENLHILFSGWRGLKMDNPYNFPTAHPIFSDGTSAPDGTLLCTGNCTECLKEDRICWNMKPGEAVGFIVH